MNERIDDPVAHLGCAECGANGGYALYCVRCAEKFVGGKEWVGLTDDEFDFLVPYCSNEFDLMDYKEFYKSIEAKLKEKNNP